MRVPIGWSSGFWRRGVISCAAPLKRSRFVGSASAGPLTSRLNASRTRHTWRGGTTSHCPRLSRIRSGCPQWWTTTRTLGRWESSHSGPGPDAGIWSTTTWEQGSVAGSSSMVRSTVDRTAMRGNSATVRLRITGLCATAATGGAWRRCAQANRLGSGQLRRSGSNPDAERRFCGRGTGR